MARTYLLSVKELMALAKGVSIDIPIEYDSIKLSESALRNMVAINPDPPEPISFDDLTLNGGRQKIETQQIEQQPTADDSEQSADDSERLPFLD